MPCVAVSFRLYKYSEHELELYLKGHKNYWGKLGKFMNVKGNQYKERLIREIIEMENSERTQKKHSFGYVRNSV